MKKTLITVFIIIGILVLALVLWAIFFGGGIQALIRGVVTPINNVWGMIVGDGTSQLIPIDDVLDQDNADATNLADADNVF